MQIALDPVLWYGRYAGDEMKAVRRMTIGKAAQRAGVGVETIRFYERRGLIEQPPKPGMGGFRLYPAETVQRIRSAAEALIAASKKGLNLQQLEDLS